MKITGCGSAAALQSFIRKNKALLYITDTRCEIISFSIFFYYYAQENIQRVNLLSYTYFLRAERSCHHPLWSRAETTWLLK